MMISQMSLVGGEETIAQMKSSFSNSLLKSNLQKAVRQTKVDIALKTAKAHMIQSPKDFFRRLPIIILEDGLLHPQYDVLMRACQNSSRSAYQLTIKDADMALNIVKDIAGSPIRDDFDKTNPDKGKKATENVTDEERSLVSAIIYRSKIGGMVWDMNMLMTWANIWLYRFSTDWSIDRLKSYFPSTSEVTFDDVGKLKKEDIILQAVDAHCSPLLKILIKKTRVHDAIKSEYPNDELDAFKRLSDVMWNCWSAISNKNQLIKGRPVNYPIDDGEQAIPGSDLEKYQRIFHQIEAEVESIAQWYIDKQ